MDIKLFQQKLNDICAIAEENNKQLSQQQIRDHFDESDLSTSQLVKILQYLKLKGITIEGADEGTGATRADAVSSESSDKEELPGTRAALTAEEQAYLSDYMESFSPEGLDPDDLASLFQAFAKGDTAAEGALTQFYMAQAAQMAAELTSEKALANGAIAMNPTAFDWAGLILISFILPAILCPLINQLCRKAGWVKDGDLKLP